MKQTSDRQALCEEIVRDYERRRRERRALELQWRLNMDFYNGKQYAEITPLGDVEEYGKQFCWQEREACVRRATTSGTCRPRSLRLA